MKKFYPQILWVDVKNLQKPAVFLHQLRFINFYAKQIQKAHFALLQKQA